MSSACGKSCKKITGWRFSPLYIISFDKLMDYQRLDRYVNPENFRGRPAVFVQLWWLVQKTLFAWSPQFMFGWRRFLLRLFGAKIGKKVHVRPSCQITFPWKVSIGDYAWVGDDVVLYSLGEIEIGEHAVISQRAYLCTGSHDYSAIGFDIYQKPVRIGAQVWIAADVYVAPGVVIGAGAVVGARSTVFQDLPGGMICYGYPAVPVRSRETWEQGHRLPLSEGQKDSQFYSCPGKIAEEQIRSKVQP